MSPQGLVQKYVIFKRDLVVCSNCAVPSCVGCTLCRPVEQGADYFVLRLDKDPHALTAAIAYAASISHVNPQLSADLLTKVTDYIKKQWEVRCNANSSKGAV